MRVLLLLAAAAPLACAPATTGDCAGPADCAPLAAAPCDGCAAVAVEACRDGVCADVAAAEVDVTADVSVDRDWTGDLRLLQVVADDAVPCSAAVVDGALAPAVNVLAATDKALSGGSFHEDVSFGRVPAGAVVVLAFVDDAAGARLGDGCVDGLTAAAPSLHVELLQIAP